jgi:predicted alpha-1,2-mannosidase
MKRFLKWLAVFLCVVMALPILGVLYVFGFYHSVVSSTPGALKVNLAPGELGSRVNPFIGTGGFPWMCGHDTPAATTPFGMVRLGPDTASILINQTGLNRSGYYFGDNKIIGFSHTRLVGADALEGGVFRVFPTVESRAEWARGKDRFARFSHRNETAFPGYYAVRLPKDNVLVELTATPRVGVHRYTFRKHEAPHLLVDITSALGDHKCKDGVVMVNPQAHEIAGTVRTFGSFSSRYGGLDVNFMARFSRPFSKFGTWNGERFTPGADGAAGDAIGADLCFEGLDAEALGVVEVRLAISCVSIGNARKNLEAEAAGRSFEDVAAAARDAWEKQLALIHVQGGTEHQQRIFYTALYHAFQMPTVFNDVNGEYMGFDRAVHKAEGFRYFTDFSLWDTFRTVQPLYNLIARNDQRDMMVSLVEMAKAGGCFPRWPSGCGYTNCMLGTPADIAVTEAYLKGVRDFDVETAYRAMRQTALTGKPETSRFAGREGLDWYLKLGYCPSDRMGESAAATLEYAWADDAISLLAQELGHKEDAEIFAKHAQFYRNVWNPATQHFEPKDTQGNFPKERNPLVLSYVDFKRKYAGGYVEGSGEQWRWAVPYDAGGLISLFASRDSFIRELEVYFARSKPGVGSWNPGPYYWHGNEPYIHAAYLFNAAGRPDLTQKWVRWILKTKYSDDYVGLDGNDDGGTLSAWYVLSALGFYPIAGTKRYEIGAPLFAKAEAHIGDNVLTVIAENSAPENIYVQRVWLNNSPLDRTWFTHDEIAQGGVLRFEMGPTPP